MELTCTAPVTTSPKGCVFAVTFEIWTSGEDLLSMRKSPVCFLGVAHPVKIRTVIKASAEKTLDRLQNCLTMD
jgi:hypothetical protein